MNVDTHDHRAAALLALARKFYIVRRRNRTAFIVWHERAQHTLDEATDIIARLPEPSRWEIMTHRSLNDWLNETPGSTSRTLYAGAKPDPDAVPYQDEPLEEPAPAAPIA